MVTIDLRNTTPEDMKIIQELKSLGVPDELIQIGYDETVSRRERNGNEKAITKTIY